MFPSGYPVICSSGRVALYIALKELKFDRSKKINLYPYTDHCVISATGRISNPSAYNKNNKMDVVYHQWGITYSCNHKPLVEDSVDSLYEKNTSLFANGSNFEVVTSKNYCWNIIRRNPVVQKKIRCNFNKIQIKS